MRKSISGEKMMHGNVILHPRADHQTPRRFWQGCPTIQCTPKGTLFAGWYSGGAGEPSLGNYNLLVRSRDGGLTWSDPLLVIESLREEDILAIDIQLWMDPSRRMWLFWTQRNLHFPKEDPRHLELWAIVCEDPDAEILSWSEPRAIAPGFLRCRPTVLSDGRWLLCAYDWVGSRYHYSESSDSGKTWIRKEAGEKVPTDFDESMILERNDGSLWMLARCCSGALAESVSTDGGTTWSSGRLTAIPSPNTRFFLRRLQSGRVLLIKNDNAKERILRLNMTINDSSDISIRKIKNISLQLKKRGKCDIIYIDYLQLIDMRGENNTYNREQEVAQVSRKCKIMAKELNVPVVLLSQLNRECEKRADKIPLLSDLRESGAVEQDADIILFIHRPEYYADPGEIINGECVQSGKGFIIIAKNRNGKTGKTVFYYDQTLSQISDEQIDLYPF